MHRRGKLARGTTHTMLYNGPYAIGVLDESGQSTEISTAGAVALPPGSKFLIKAIKPDAGTYKLDIYISSKLVYDYVMETEACIGLIPNEKFIVPDSGLVTLSVLFTPAAKLNLPPDKELVEPCWDGTKSQFIHLRIQPNV